MYDLSVGTLTGSEESASFFWILSRPFQGMVDRMLEKAVL
jgi:hypothetical protein